MKTRVCFCSSTLEGPLGFARLNLLYCFFLLVVQWYFILFLYAYLFYSQTFVNFFKHFHFVFAFNISLFLLWIICALVFLSSYFVLGNLIHLTLLTLLTWYGYSSWWSGCCPFYVVTRDPAMHTRRGCSAVVPYRTRRPPLGCL